MPDYGLNVAEAFQKYLKTGDDSIIENYSAKQLQQAVSKLSPYYDHNKLWYREIEKRIISLSNRAERHRILNATWAEKWVDKIIFLLIGLIVGIYFF